MSCPPFLSLTYLLAEQDGLCEIKVVQGPREKEIQTIHQESEGPSLVAFIFIDKEENISQFDDEPLNQKKAVVCLLLNTYLCVYCITYSMHCHK